jgi:hypothetical protein
VDLLETSGLRCPPELLRSSPWPPSLSEIPDLPVGNLLRGASSSALPSPPPLPHIRPIPPPPPHIYPAMSPPLSLSPSARSSELRRPDPTTPPRDPPLLLKPVEIARGRAGHTDRARAHPNQPWWCIEQERRPSSVGPIDHGGASSRSGGPLRPRLQHALSMGRDDDAGDDDKPIRS